MIKPADQKLAKVDGKELYRMVKDGATVDIGGLDDDSTFYPEVMSSKWDGECWLKISHADKLKIKKDNKAKTKDLGDGNIEIEIDVDGTGRKHRFREGSIHWDIEYASVDDLPSDDIERFALEFPYDQLTWHHQSELTQEEIDDGHFRPENVINSYAGYFNKANRLLRPFSIAGLTYEDVELKISTGEIFQEPVSGIYYEEVYNYGTGKAWHIYRQKLIAADGTETWIVQWIEDSILKSSIPRQWCIDHGFPVVLDPYVGNTSQGASEFTVGTVAWATPIDTGSGDAGEVQKLWGFFRNTKAFSRTLEMALMIDPPGNPVAGQASTTINASSANQNLSVDVSGSAYSISGSTRYWQGCKFSGDETYVYYDSAATGIYNKYNNTWDDSWSTSGTHQKNFSMYIEYVASGESLLPIKFNKMIRNNSLLRR